MDIATVIAARTRFFYGWWVVFATAGIIFLCGGTFFYGFGALFNPIVQEFGWSHAAISFAFSLRNEIGGVAAPVVGFLLDRIGARRLLVAGVLLVVIGFVLLSRMNSLWSFYGSVLVISAGMAATGSPVAATVVAHWFRRRRGRALGMLTVGAGVSGIMVLVLEHLISSFGWRSALVLVGLVQLAVALPLALSVRDRPQEMGLQPDGDDAPPSAVPAGQGETPAAGLTTAQAVRTPLFWRLSIAVALAQMGATAVIVHQIPFFTGGLGLSESAAAAFLAATTFVSLVGRVGFGSLTDYIGTRWVLGAAYGVQALGILLFALLEELWQVFLVLPLFAVGFGGGIPAGPAFQAQYFGLRSFGSIQGLVITVATLGAVAGPVLAGAMYDWGESYRPAFLLLGAANLVAVPLVAAAGRPQGGG